MYLSKMGADLFILLQVALLEEVGDTGMICSKKKKENPS